MQVWPMYPEDVSRTGGHPAPFPVLLPRRLVLMYTFAAVPEEGFAGDVVLDMFCGTGATCVAAKATGRRYIGIEIVEDAESKAPAAVAAGKIKAAVREMGVLIGLGGAFGNVLRIQPPLTISDDELDKVLAAIKEVLEA